MAQIKANRKADANTILMMIRIKMTLITGQMSTIALALTRRYVSLKSDKCHVFVWPKIGGLKLLSYPILFIREALVANVAITTTVIELKGISIAAIIGVSCPVTAK